MMVLKRPMVVAIIVLLTSAIAVMVISIVQQLMKVTVPFGLKYGIVFDAGASSTTVYVYNWPAEKENNTGVVSETYKCESEGSAISHFDKEPAKAARSIEWCLNRTIDVIPAEKHNVTPLYLGATAGMRLLQIRNPTVASMILTVIEGCLHSSPFEFKSAQIISGKEEGAYGWITANYLLDNFRQGRTWTQPKRKFTITTKGTLDLGGASSEIAFVPKQHSLKYNSTVITLYNYNYYVYIESLACYGRDEAEKIYWAKLIQNSANESKIEDPCLPTHYTMKLQLEEVFESSCIVDKLPENYNADVTLIGTGNPTLCHQLLLSTFMFTSSYVKGAWTERLNVINQLIHGEFVAFSGFSETMEALNLTGSFPMDIFLSTVKSFCMESWNQVQQSLPNMSDSDRRAQCFNANYIYALLVRGYKFNHETWTKISFQKQVENSNMGWSLGYMLNQTNMIPAEIPVSQTPMSEFAFSGLLFLFSTMVLVCSIFICLSIIRSF